MVTAVAPVPPGATVLAAPARPSFCTYSTKTCSLVFGLPAVLLCLGAGLTFIIIGVHIHHDGDFVEDVLEDKWNVTRGDEGGRGEVEANAMFVIGGLCLLLAVAFAWLIRCQYRQSQLSNSSGRVIARRPDMTPMVARVPQPVPQHSGEPQAQLPFHASPYSLTPAYPPIYPPFQTGSRMRGQPIPPAPIPTGGMVPYESSTANLGLVTPYQLPLAYPGYVAYYPSLGSNVGQGAGPYPGPSAAPYSSISQGAPYPPFASTSGQGQPYSSVITEEASAPPFTPTPRSADLPPDYATVTNSEKGNPN